MFAMSQAQETTKAKGVQRMSVCKYCDELGHTRFNCPRRPRTTLKTKKAMKKIGRVTKQWMFTRKEWIKQNPPNHKGQWKCYLHISPQCLKYVDKDTMQLDHKVSRVRDPNLRFSLDNLAPACGPCNALKGSRDLEELRA